MKYSFKFKGIITKLEFKAMLYLSGFDKTSISDVINMESYFYITYKNVNNNVTTKTVDKRDIYECIKEHSKTLLVHPC